MSNLFNDVHKGEPIKNEVGTLHYFLRFVERKPNGEVIIKTHCGKKLSSFKTTGDKSRVTCERCKRKFTTNKKYK